MKMRPLGANAPDVFPIGFGGMPLSEEGRPTEAAAIRVIHAVLDAGVTLLDLSNVYGSSDAEIGHNERLFSKALASWGGSLDRIVVATKGGRWRHERGWEVDARPSQLRLACENSLMALGVDQIDLYQLNVPDPNVPFEDSVGALAELQSEGKIRWIGISNVDVDQITLARSIVEVVTVQNRLNPSFRESLETGVVDHCSKQSIGFLAYHPVGGWLSKELGAHKLLKRIGARHGVSSYAVAIAWEIAQGSTVIPLPSARTVEHALDSISGAGVHLEPEELSTIDGARFPTDYFLRRRLRNRIARTVKKVLGR